MDADADTCDGGHIDPGLLLVAETVDAAQEQAAAASGNPPGLLLVAETVDADADTCDGGRSQFGNG